MDAKALVGDEARRYLEMADELIVLPAEELAVLEAGPKPHWDATLRFGGAACKNFVRRLADVGLVAWRLRARQHIGVFFVRKKGTVIRMVLDCRPTNCCHRSPSHSALATPGAPWRDQLGGELAG